MRIHESDDRLEIRIRHYAMRFLCLVLGIVALVAFNNPKKPDGPVLSLFFGAATVVLLLATRAVTIDLDRNGDKFSLRYGGILFGILRKSVERPLHDLRYAETQIGSQSGSTRTTMGRGSRLVLVFSTGEKIPMTRFFSSGDMGDHHAVEQRVNAFLTSAASTQRKSTAD